MYSSKITIEESEIHEPLRIILPLPLTLNPKFFPDAKGESQISAKSHSSIKTKLNPEASEKDQISFKRCSIKDDFQVKQSTTKMERSAHQFLHTIKYIAGAVNKFQSRTVFRQAKLANERHFEIIGDKTHLYNSNFAKDNQMALLLATTSILRNYYKMKIFLQKTRLFQSGMHSFSNYFYLNI